MSHLEAHVRATVLRLSAELHQLNALRLERKVKEDEFYARWNETRDKAIVQLVEIVRLERVKMLQPLPSEN